MKRKLIALLLVVVMVMAFMPTAAFAHSGTRDEHHHKNSAIGQCLDVKITAGAHGGIHSPFAQDVPWVGNNWTFTAMPDEGYVFSHWTYAGNEVSGAFTTSGPNDEVLNLSITKKGKWSWSGINYKQYYAQAVFIPDPTLLDVTLDLGAGGTFDSNGLSSIVVSGRKIDPFTVPAFTENPGYDHIEWTETPDFSSSRTIGSRYEYEVTFAGNTEITITGGSPAWTVNHNVAEASYTVAPGFRFDGWDRSLNSITAPTTINANPAVGLGTITVNKTGEGSLARAWYVNGTYDFGTPIWLNDSWPVPSHRLVGWRDNNTGAMLAPDATITVSGDCTYTAVFGEWLDTIAGVNGSLATDLDGWYEDGSNVNLNDSTPTPDTGYEFDKWVETDFFGNYQHDVVLVGGEPIITIGDSNYFEARFKPAEYTVTFVDSQADVLGTETVTHGGDVTKTAGDFTYDAGERPIGSGWNAAEGQNITADKNIVVNTEYQVTFNLDGGTRTGGGDLVQWVEYGLGAVEPIFDPPVGETFTGWDKSFASITQAETITAQYTDNEYTLTINYLDRDDNSVLIPAYVGTYNYGDTYSIISPAVLGYDLPSIDTVAGTIATDDVDVTVYYDSHTFKLTYMQVDGDEPTDLREYRIYHKDSVSNEYPVKVGYKLAGSSTIVEIGNIEFINSEANRFTNPFLFNTSPIGIAPAGETCIIYWYDEDNAEWIQADTKASSTLYQATFDANGGAFADTSIVKFDYAYVGGSIVSPDLPTKTGYTFVGWDVNEDGVIDASDDLNSDGLYDAADIDEISMNTNIVITAIYEINTFEVKFFDHDGTQIGATQTVDWNTAATAPADPTREGHTFAGWDKAFDAVTADLDVNATYTINTFEVKFFDHDGTQIGATQTVDWNTAATAPADPTREGHTFAGWDKAFDAVTADLDVNATYTINTFEVKFFDHDGTQIGTTQTVDWNTAATAPADPTRVGHTFADWDNAFDAVTADLDVTATYTINSYTVTFVDHDGTVLKTQVVNWRGAATAPADPTRDGYEFTGWDKEFDNVVGYMTVTALYNKLDDPQEPEEDGYLVQFFDDEGNLISEQRVEEGGAAEAPEPPEKEGYEFAGWDKEFDPVTQDLVVTALYTKLDVPSTDIIEDEDTAEADVTDTDSDAGSFAWWWIVVGAGAIALLLLILFFVKRRKDEEEEA